MVFIGARRLLRRNPELGWARVTGVVRECSVNSFKNPQGFGNAGHEVLVRYEYEFEGKRLECDRIAPMYRASHLMRHTAEEHARRYPVGSAVDVYVNPADPAEAVLEPEQQTFRAFAWCFIGLALLGVAWAIYVASPSAT